MHVLIAGGGTMGREIAKALPEHEIVIVEKNPEVCERDSEELGVKVVQGDCTLHHILNRAGFDRADVVIAVTDRDEVNLLVSLFAKKKGKQVISRVKTARYSELFEELGLDNIISPERRAALDIVKRIVWK